ncbi:PREDICTED: uncharacterized protein LOC108449197 [Corvus brachyrhynchos]|uniref:uncharacterized protein LOC108449197 n=1 Tax=Corvus brachyrhynchos TaxID=85066 RepID=UPI00081652E3|nr:PREDICTED: uncharacterized protein LOC108449197 [Corvus brachyrhynchos]
MVTRPMAPWGQGPGAWQGPPAGCQGTPQGQGRPRGHGAGDGTGDILATVPAAITGDAGTRWHFATARRHRHPSLPITGAGSVPHPPGRLYKATATRGDSPERAGHGIPGGDTSAGPAMSRTSRAALRGPPRGRPAGLTAGSGDTAEPVIDPDMVALFEEFLGTGSAWRVLVAPWPCARGPVALSPCPCARGQLKVGQAKVGQAKVDNSRLVNSR